MGTIALLATLEGIRIHVSNAAVFLIIGGLAVLFLIVALFLIQGLLPASIDQPLAAGKGHRKLRPMYGTHAPAPAAAPARAGVRWGGSILRRRAEEAAPVPRIDTTLDRLVAEKLGEPRIIRRTQNSFLVRVLECRECARHDAASPPLDVAGCGQVRGKLQDHARSVFGTIVRVQERACRAWGARACDFEVVP